LKRIACALLVTTACGGAPSAYAKHFAAAERAETAGRHQEAAEQFDAASRDPATKREQEHAAFLSALELVRAGDVAAGAKRLEAIVNAKGEHAAQARWELVQMDIATNQPNVKEELDAYVRTYPNDGIAYPALEARLRMARDAGGEAEVLTVLRALEPAIATTDSAARVAFEIGESLAKQNKLDEARAQFVAVATKFPYPGEYWDDALWRASELDEQLGRVPDAIADLERMLSVIEYATLPGTYIRPRFPDAQWRIAVLYRDKVGDKSKAIAAFDRFVDMFSNSARKDEALWQEAKLTDDAGASCDLLSRLVKINPDSRYVPCAMSRCSKIERPKDSHAPKTCHAYITR
jgi:tetratricopeptide (TPR) repeat protein